MSIEYLDKTLIAISENGQTISPILSEGIKNYLIGIGGTICDDILNEQPERMLRGQLYPEALATLNKWYDEEHIICFFTSRTEEYRKYTKIWLDKHGFKYHRILMGQPRGGNYHWIDNHLVKATRYQEKFTNLINKQVTIQVFDDAQHQYKFGYLFNCLIY
ncbi:phosphoheptose isomerase [Flavobacterium psychrophilum]|nr:phosphoheptose isomerase [Flavobacterium psychrophilum]